MRLILKGLINTGPDLEILICFLSNVNVGVLKDLVQLVLVGVSLGTKLLRQAWEQDWELALEEVCFRVLDFCYNFFNCKNENIYYSVYSAVGTAQMSLFGNNQNKLGSTLGSMGTFGTGGFNTGANTLNFGAPQQPVGQC